MIYTKDNPKLVGFFLDFEDKDIFTGVVKDRYNTIAYYLNGKSHRTDGPAITYASGEKQWWLNDRRHREDGPAVELSHDSKEWWLNGKAYGHNDDYTNESWIRFVKLELLK